MAEREDKEWEKRRKEKEDREKEAEQGKAPETEAVVAGRSRWGAEETIRI